MKKFLFFVIILSFSVFTYGQKRKTANKTPDKGPSIVEYKIDSSTYRIVSDTYEDKLFYLNNTTWEQIDLFVCDTASGCDIKPVCITKIYKDGKFLIILYSYVGNKFQQEIYLDKKGAPDWRDPEDRPRN